MADIAQVFQHKDDDGMDFAEVKGQENVTRTLEIGAAGGHNALTFARALTQRRF
ncbi:MAG TPA: ATP-binding protein [Dongiaceae bacterium]|nr:ATP-binding protein [Dongiaceae bacterium]